LITIICNVSPTMSDYQQTLSTCKFGSRAKNITIKPIPIPMSPGIRSINESPIKEYLDAYSSGE
jgi:hypothetical protein